MDFIETLKIIVLGLVEGFTEWLPISSTGHLILVEELIPLNQPQAYIDMFEVVVQLGAILAVVVLYFHRLNPFDSRKTPRQRRGTIHLWIKILIACLPAAVIGLLADDFLHEHLYNPWVVATALIIYGVLFIVLERRNAHTKFIITRTGQITYQTALLIGCIQLLALIPGTSRSGSTILGAMLIGCSRGVAAEFSFFLGIPVMFGASFLEIIKYIASDAVFTAPQIFYMILGMIVAFSVSVCSIKFLMTYIKQNDFKVFGYYRIILGVIVLIYFGVRTALKI